MIEDFSEQGKSSGITLVCDRECAVIEGKRWRENLESLKDAIVFIDEGQRFIKTREFASCLKNSPNYFVLVTREKLSALPYSVNEIYGIREHGKYPAMTQVYNELYQIYTESENKKCEKPELIITEDKRSGFQFFDRIQKEQQGVCESADGKSNILSYLIKLHKEDGRILVIVDGVAFGPEMEEIVDYIRYHKNVYLYTPESFEWIILKSGLISGISDELVCTYNYADSVEYMSWEQYFTELLIKLTQDTVYQYGKENLKEYYLSSRNRQMIMNVMKGISFQK